TALTVPVAGNARSTVCAGAIVPIPATDAVIAPREIVDVGNGDGLLLLLSLITTSARMARIRTAPTPRMIRRDGNARAWRGCVIAAMCLSFLLARWLNELPAVTYAG